MAAGRNPTSRRRRAVGGRIPALCVWYMRHNIVFEARLVNREIGSYKGYPLDNDEWPMGIEQVYAET